MKQIDASDSCHENDHALNPPSESTVAAIKLRPSRRWWRWMMMGLVGVAAVVIWLNGPGVRWLAPRVAAHFLGKTGMQINFVLDGSITGGLTVRDLHLASDGVLEDLTIRRVVPDYRIEELVRGKLRGIAVDGVRALINIDEKKQGQATADEVNQRWDVERLRAMLEEVRKQLVPVAIDLDDMVVNVVSDGKAMVSLAPSAFHHASGGGVMNLNLGSMTMADGRVWPARESKIIWQEDRILLDRLGLLPGLEIRELAVHLAADDGLAGEAKIAIDDAVFEVEMGSGFRSLRVDLIEGKLVAGEVLARWGIDLPVTGELTSLSANIDGVMPEPMVATGSLRVLLENGGWRDWRADELSLDAEVGVDLLQVMAAGHALGSGFTVSADMPLVGGEDRFKLSELRGAVTIADVAGVLGDLSKKVGGIRQGVVVPRSVLDGVYKLEMKDGKAAAAEVTLQLKPSDVVEVSPLSVKCGWKDDQSLVVVGDVDGLHLTGEYGLGSGDYAAKVKVGAGGDFMSGRIDRWLALFADDTQGVFSLAGNMEVSGNIKSAMHRGELVLERVVMRREGMPEMRVAGDVAYDWPSAAEVKNLRLEVADQLVLADARLSGGVLDVSRLAWSDHGKELATGKVSLPVPEDMVGWREMLGGDKRPLLVDLDSQIISLAVLKDWLPAAAQLDPASTGHVTLKVVGTCVEPEVSVLLELKNLRSPAQPKLPAADIRANLAGRSGLLRVDGQVVARDFAPAVMTASMPFRPAEWAGDPAKMMGEMLTARVDLPRIDVSRFGSLVAGVRKLTGIVSGNVEVAGPLNKPEIKGKLMLSAAGFELADGALPPVTGLAAAVDVSPERVVVSNGVASMAGGGVKAAGSMTIVNGKPSMLDFRVTANHLPLVRNDSLIVRSNADLRLEGMFEKASLTGTIGVVDSLFYRDIELLPMGSPFTGPSAAALPKIDAVVVKPEAALPEPIRNWAVNVRARTENPFLVRGNIAKGQVDMNVRVGGTLGRPEPDGEVKISELKAALPFSTLRIRTGRLRFTPGGGFDPVLEIRGTAEPRPYRVNVFAYGRLSAPQMVLTSSPPLPENEIMTLLATGTTTSGLEDPQAASSRAMQLLAEELRRGRILGGSKLRPIFSLLDRVDFSLAEVDPYTSESFSTATISLTDRWFVSAGMGADGDSRVLGIWRISFR